MNKFNILQSLDNMERHAKAREVNDPILIYNFPNRSIATQIPNMLY